LYSIESEIFYQFLRTNLNFYLKHSEICKVFNIIEKTIASPTLCAQLMGRAQLSRPLPPERARTRLDPSAMRSISSRLRRQIDAQRQIKRWRSMKDDAQRWTLARWPSIEGKETVPAASSGRPVQLTGGPGRQT